jgi:hypothetical protein
MSSEIQKNDNYYVFNCPHCLETIIVSISELNCRIFRHGIYKNTYKQVDPHLNKIECDRLLNEDKVYGCCKPFEIITNNNKLFCVKCDYK